VQLIDATTKAAAVQLKEGHVQRDQAEDEQAQLVRVQMVLSRAHPMSDEDWRQLHLTIATTDSPLGEIMTQWEQARWDLEDAEHRLTPRGEHDLGPITEEEVTARREAFEEVDRSVREACAQMGTTPEELEIFWQDFPLLFIERAKEIAEVADDQLRSRHRGARPLLRRYRRAVGSGGRTPTRR
jgi:hypothetical protein